mmetsp:Transcript_69710/g.194014  ORF Transcript_69710/g.194014 Transcript_69710/m.194014 type:complete len:282 (-) Transcript_69710:584-1429(-)
MRKGAGLWLFRKASAFVRSQARASRNNPKSLLLAHAAKARSTTESVADGEFMIPAVPSISLRTFISASPDNPSVPFATSLLARPRLEVLRLEQDDVTADVSPVMGMASALPKIATDASAQACESTDCTGVSAWPQVPPSLPPVPVNRPCPEAASQTASAVSTARSALSVPHWARCTQAQVRGNVSCGRLGRPHGGNKHNTRRQRNAMRNTRVLAVSSATVANLSTCCSIKPGTTAASRVDTCNVCTTIAQVSASARTFSASSPGQTSSNASREARASSSLW